MKAPSPTGKASSRRSDAPLTTLFTTFCRRLLGITRTDRRLLREETPRSMRREVRAFAIINFTLGDRLFLLANATSRCATPRLRTWRMIFEQLRITFYIHQNFPGDDFGLSKIKVVQACFDKFQYFIVRRVGALAALEYHQCDTDTFAPIQHIIGSETV